MHTLTIFDQYSGVCSVSQLDACCISLAYSQILCTYEYIHTVFVRRASVSAVRENSFSSLDRIKCVCFVAPLRDRRTAKHAARARTRFSSRARDIRLYKYTICKVRIAQQHAEYCRMQRVYTCIDSTTTESWAPILSHIRGGARWMSAQSIRCISRGAVHVFNEYRALSSTSSGSRRWSRAAPKMRHLVTAVCMCYKCCLVRQKDSCAPLVIARSIALQAKRECPESYILHGHGSSHQCMCVKLGCQNSSACGMAMHKASAAQSGGAFERRWTKRNASHTSAQPDGETRWRT